MMQVMRTDGWTHLLASRPALLTEVMTAMAAIPQQ